MPMRCPRCSTPPPFDPFLCTTCGEHLLTYLDEPLGPGSGIRPEAAGVGADARTAGGTTEPRSGGLAGGSMPPGWVGDPAQDPREPQPLLSAPPRQTDNT